jgi:cell division protein FtsB
MNKAEEIEILQNENDELKHTIKDLQYDNAEHQKKDDVLWNSVDIEKEE